MMNQAIFLNLPEERGGGLEIATPLKKLRPGTRENNRSFGS